MVGALYGEVRDVHGGRPHWRFRLALRERPAPLHQTPPRSLLLVARFEIPFRKESSVLFFTFKAMQQKK